MKKILRTPLTEAAVRSLRAGDRVLLSGRVYTGRDAAHKRLCAMLETEEGTLSANPRQAFPAQWQHFTVTAQRG